MTTLKTSQDEKVTLDRVLTYRYDTCEHKKTIQYVLVMDRREHASYSKVGRYATRDSLLVPYPECQSRRGSE